MLNKLKIKLLKHLLGELCVKSGGCRSCPARLNSDNSQPYSCAHGPIYEQMVLVWKANFSVNPIERSK